MTLKIKKLDDKPMIIHMKKKPKLHNHISKNNKVKQVNKTNKKDIMTKSNKSNMSNKFNRSLIARYRRHINEANKSIKTKKTSIKLAGAGVRKVTSQLECGEELQQATSIVNDASRPVIGLGSKGAELYKKNVLARRKQRIRQVEAGKRLSKRSVKKTTTDIAKKSAKEVTKTVVKETAKATASVVGTATSGSVIGHAASKEIGQKIDEAANKHNSRTRKLKYFLDKLNAEDKQKDSLGKLVKDLLMNKVKFVIYKYAGAILGAIVLLFALGALAIIPVVVPITMMYNSPFALFLPALNEGDTVMSVTKQYLAEFNEEVENKAKEHKGCDKGEVIYKNYEGATTPSNYADIMCVYMVKYGVGDTATDMNIESKKRLKEIVDDMCSYSISKKIKTINNDDGTKSTAKVMYVNVKLKTYSDMIEEYKFDKDKEELLISMINSDYINEIIGSDILGEVPSGTGSGEKKSSLSQEEINTILDKIEDGILKKVVAFTLSKVGYPYSQAKRDSGDYYDCSSLAYYAWKAAGKNISYKGSNTAAEEARGLNAAGKEVAYKEIRPGDLIFFSYCKNGRYKNISHVAIYVGGGKVVEAKSEKYGVVYGDVPNKNCIVMVGRP